MSKIWTEDENNEFKDLYFYLNKKELAKYFKVSNASISSKARRLGLSKVKNSNPNPNFFENIDTEEKAYWLGFIYADGYIISNGKNRNYELGIELSVVDIEHLKKFNSLFDNYYKVSTRKRMSFGKEIGMCNIRLYSKKIVQDLQNNGIVQNKTHSNVFPKIENEDLFFHFLRGYIDGDGSYNVKTKQTTKGIKEYPRISITGNNKECFEYISIKLAEYKINTTLCKDKNSWKLSIERRQDCLTLINLLFKNSNVFLDRKHTKKEILKSIAV